MRNLVQFPITDQEVRDALQRRIDAMQGHVGGTHLPIFTALLVVLGEDPEVMRRVLGKINSPWPLKLSDERTKFEKALREREGPSGDTPGYPGQTPFHWDEREAAWWGWYSRAVLAE